MIQVRQGVFETNSSSVHSIAICTKNEFNAWRNGELYKNDGWWGNSISPLKRKDFLTYDEAMELIASSFDYRPRGESEDISEYLEKYEIYDYENWGSYYETDVTNYTTPHGEEIVAVCYYGYN